MYTCISIVESSDFLTDDQNQDLILVLSSCIETLDAVKNIKFTHGKNAVPAINDYASDLKRILLGKASTILERGTWSDVSLHKSILSALDQDMDDYLKAD